MNYEKIPRNFRVGGQLMEVRRVDRCEGNDLGSCFLAGGYVEIADKCNKDDTQSESSKINTFYHELTHSILKTMGEDDLNNNERFVCSFSSFLTEAMAVAVFPEGPAGELGEDGLLVTEMTRFIEAHYHTRFDETLENGNSPLTTHDFEDIARHFYELGRSQSMK